MERLIPWKPCDTNGDKFIIHSILHSCDGLSVQLSTQSGNKKLEILFDGSIDTYRYNPNMYDLSFFNDHSFFQVKNSEYVDWLYQKSGGLSQNYNFMHFVIISNQYTFEILSRYNPQVNVVL